MDGITYLTLRPTFECMACGGANGIERLVHQYRVTLVNVTPDHNTSHVLYTFVITSTLK